MPAAKARAWRKIQGLPIAAAGGRHAVDAGLDEHVQAILSREQVAAAQHDPRAGVLLHFAQKAQSLGPS